MTGTIVCDLDGVVYLGERLIDGADNALRRALAAGYRLLFATNNSTRSAADVAAKLAAMTGVDVAADQVVTSAEVAAGLVEEGPVLVVGEAGIYRALAAAGWEVTADPEAARTVMVGLDRRLHYDKIAAAAEAVRRGARLLATNRDPTLPTEGGLLPGAGACLAAIEVAAGVTAVSAGKPSEAMRSEIERRAAPGPIWMIGDRADTDLAMAMPPRWQGILVLSGATSDPEGLVPAPAAVVTALPGAIDLILETGRTGDADGG